MGREMIFPGYNSLDLGICLRVMGHFKLHRHAVYDIKTTTVFINLD